MDTTDTIETLPQLHHRYSIMRIEALKRARSQIVTKLPHDLRRGFGLACFCHDTIERVSEWEHAHLDRGREGLDWPALYVGDWIKHPRRFEVAIWHNKTLCGLALGRVSKNLPLSAESKVRIDLMEGNPLPANPMNGYITEIVIECAYQYAHLIGRRYVCIPHIENELLVTRYKSYGFIERPKAQSFKDGLWFSIDDE